MADPTVEQEIRQAVSEGVVFDEAQRGKIYQKLGPKVYEELFVPKGTPEEYSKTGAVRSAIQGLGQGVTMGFSEYPVAGINSLISGREFGDEKKLYRDYLQRLKETESGAYTAGDIAGMVAPAAMPLKALGLGAKGATVAAKLTPGLVAKEALKGGVMSGAANVGYSDAEDKGALEIGKQFGEGFAFGAPISGAVPIAGKLLKGAKDFAAPRLFGAATGSGGDAVLEKLANPGRVQAIERAGFTEAGMAERLNDVFKSERDTLYRRAGERFNELVPATSKLAEDDLLKIANERVNKLGSIGMNRTDFASAKAAIGNIIDAEVEGYGRQGIPLGSALSVAKKLDDLASGSAGASGEFLRGADKKVNQAIQDISEAIKKKIEVQAPEAYREVTKLQQTEAKALESLFDMFKTPAGIKQGLRNMRTGKMDTASYQELNRIGEKLGMDIPGELRAVNAAEKFRGGAEKTGINILPAMAVQGVIGGGVGASQGGGDPLAMIAGAGAGLTRAYYGPKIGGKILDKYTGARDKLAAKFPRLAQADMADPLARIAARAGIRGQAQPDDKEKKPYSSVK